MNSAATAYVDSAVPGHSGIYQPPVLQSQRNFDPRRSYPRSAAMAATQPASSSQPPLVHPESITTTMSGPENEAVPPAAAADVERGWASGTYLPSGPPLVHPESVPTAQPTSEYDVNYVPMPELNHKLIRRAPIGERSETPKYVLRQGEVENPDALTNERRMYSPDKLNSMQQDIYAWAKSQPTDIALVQAGPGCGKSFTLLTIATTTVGDVVIYKRDLLDMFMMQMRRFTVCRFGMTTFDVDFCGWKGLEKTVSSNMTQLEFMLMIAGMLARARLPNMAGSLVLLDEYTVISKPVLVSILILLESYGIGTLMCGDRNQLQNIFNSRHAPLSAYELGCSFAKHKFTLKENIRCQNQHYRDIIDMMADMSSERPLDDNAFAIVSAVFPQQLIAETCYTDTHLAGNHCDLTWLAHMLVIRETIPHAYYLLDMQGTADASALNKKTIMPDELALYFEQSQKVDPYTGQQIPWVGRFLPYLPLKPGGRYYLHRYSERSVCTLDSVGYNAHGEVDVAWVKLDSEPDRLVKVGRENCDAVMFDQHREELLRNHSEPGKLRRGHLNNLPLYPANFFTIHKSQGITIANSPVDLLLASTGTSYRSLYVAMSRVKTQDQISRVYIHRQQTFLLSTVLNFKSFSLDPHFRVTAEILKARIPYDYPIWETRPGVDKVQVQADLVRFWLSQDAKVRTKLAQSLLMRSKISHNLGQRTARISHFEQALVHVVRHRDVFRALACLGQRDRIIWLREWTTLDPRVSDGPVHIPSICESAQAAFYRVDKLIKHLQDARVNENELRRKRKHVPLDPLPKKGDPVPESQIAAAKESKMLGATGVLDAKGFASTVEFIFARARAVDRCRDPSEGIEGAIANITNHIRLETSPFRADVFHLHREAFHEQREDVRKYPITVPWLFEKLNWLLENPHHDEDETPSYEPRPKKEKVAKVDADGGTTVQPKGSKRQGTINISKIPKPKRSK